MPMHYVELSEGVHIEEKNNELKTFNIFLVFALKNDCGYTFRS